MRNMTGYWFEFDSNEDPADWRFKCQLLGFLCFSADGAAQLNSVEATSDIMSMENFGYANPVMMQTEGNTKRVEFDWSSLSSQLWILTKTRTHLQTQKSPYSVNWMPGASRSPVTHRLLRLNRKKCYPLAWSTLKSPAWSDTTGYEVYFCLYKSRVVQCGHIARTIRNIYLSFMHKVADQQKVGH